VNWYLKVLRQYADFNGRARRKEYWIFTLISVIASIVLGFIDGLTGLMVGDGAVGILGLIYSLAVFIPSLAVSVRRLHDSGRSGWWILIAFIPLLGAIALIVFFCMDSEEGDNQYGPNPKLLS
jgi:uncharacterized membrane protein YhaH (DUF805 family)